MDTVEVLVKLPKDIYENIQKIDKILMSRRSGRTIEFALWNSVKNGTVLPKGHGDLKDVDAFIKFLQTASKTRKYDELWIDNFLTVDDVFQAIIESLKNEGGNAPTIIEADKGEDDGESD